MQIHFELYASLMVHLPPGSGRHRITLEVAELTTSQELIERHGIPDEQAHLVAINGIYTPPEERNNLLSDGDVVAVWPPVAGG